MEYLDICDERGQPTGSTVERDTAHTKGILHRTSHVWVIRERDGQYDVLLQKRSRDKESFPGMYDASSAGHVPAGSDPLSSVMREMSEEIGIRAKPGELSFAGTFRCSYAERFHGKLFRDNEIRYAYVYREPVDTASLTLQKSEVEEVRWFPLREIAEEIQTRRDRICVSRQGLSVLAEYLAGRSGSRFRERDVVLAENDGLELHEYAVVRRSAKDGYCLEWLNRTYLKKDLAYWQTHASLTVVGQEDRGIPAHMYDGEFCKNADT